jgi:hypothetical protein
LHHPEITPTNLICRFLGNGTAETGLRLLRQGAVEITDVAHYAAWRRLAWGIAGDSQRNESAKVLRRADLTPTDLAHIEAVTVEDRLLYDRIAARLAASTGPSVSGREL